MTHFKRESSWQSYACFLMSSDPLRSIIQLHEMLESLCVSLANIECCQKYAIDWPEKRHTVITTLYVQSVLKSGHSRHSTESTPSWQTTQVEVHMHTTAWQLKEDIDYFYTEPFTTSLLYSLHLLAFVVTRGPIAEWSRVCH